jgi:palmitoyltransferase ZDHHC13/17
VEECIPDCYEGDELAVEIKTLLQDKWSFLGDFLMIRIVFKKLTRNSDTFILYLALMGGSFFLLCNSTYYLLDVYGGYEWLVKTNQALFCLSIALCLLVYVTNPGYLKPSANFDWVKMLDEFETGSLCPECAVLRTPRSRHCVLCQRCVDRFDHHCPWVNNCIGRRNYKQFYLFLVSQVLFLIFTLVASCCYFHLELFRSDELNSLVDEQGYIWKARRICSIVYTFICFLFLSSVL